MKRRVQEPSRPFWSYDEQFKQRSLPFGIIIHRKAQLRRNPIMCFCSGKAKAKGVRSGKTDRDADEIGQCLMEAMRWRLVGKEGLPVWVLLQDPGSSVSTAKLKPWLRWTRSMGFWRQSEKMIAGSYFTRFWIVRPLIRAEKAFLNH